mgnify:CR=1 FL=1|tara:strand:- start:51837 stop:52301 length:465 start_codon:yes stop_codon:yes gene_type:complete
MNPQPKFSDKNEFNTFLSTKIKGELTVGYFDCEDYEGMVLAIMIVFDTQKSQFDLDLQWMSLGLDLYGDTLQESYVYRFSSVTKLLEYLDSKYSLTVSEIPLEFKFESEKFPSPITHAEKHSVFKTSWESFQSAFKQGLFLNPSLDLIYNSLDN